MTAPLVSIVVINFNYGRFLERAVTSALSQNYRPLEVVVVDDGSTDDSLEILKKFEGRITLVAKSQGGHVSAFNAGFTAAGGEVLFFLDADDLLHPDCVTKVMAVWRPSLSKVQFRLDTIDANEVNQQLPFPFYAKTLDNPEIKRRSLRFGYYPWPVSSGNAFARTFVARVAPIPQERIFKSPDGFLNKMAPLYGEVAVLDAVLGAYRVHGRNIWAQSGAGINRDTFPRTVRFDAILHHEFVTVASELGYAVRGYGSQMVPQWIENRMLSLRLCPARHPIEGDTRSRVLQLGLRSAVVAPDFSVVGRLSWAAWFIALAVLPEQALLHFLQGGRAQSGRSNLARALVRWSRPNSGRATKSDEPVRHRAPTGSFGNVRPLRLLIGIATVGRAPVLNTTLKMLARQSRVPDGILIAPASDADVAGIDLAALNATQIRAKKGLCAQRNAILAAAADYDVIVYFDDDFFPCKDYLAAVERAFREDPDIVMTTGTVVADGVSGPGLSAEAGLRLALQAEQTAPARGPRPSKYNGYGCNMAFRLDATRDGLVFDEALPQYSWLEDVDFSRRLSSRGRIVRLPDARGVHLGSKSGRTAGIKYGYSQIANPLYMVRKGTFSWPRAGEQMARNIGMNLLRSIAPEPYIDRRGRLRGNIMALVDALRHKAKPERIDSLA
jgi:glycosyltransferase involved in cell wall biosynthesis